MEKQLMKQEKGEEVFLLNPFHFSYELSSWACFPWILK